MLYPVFNSKYIKPIKQQQVCYIVCYDQGFVWFIPTWSTPIWSNPNPNPNPLGLLYKNDSVAFGLLYELYIQKQHIKNNFILLWEKLKRKFKSFNLKFL